MFARKLAFAALLTTIALIAGCGKTPGTSAGSSSERRFSAKSPIVKTNAKQAKAVYVDGRIYREDDAPAAFVLPEPAEPQTGKGHARVVFSTAGVSSAKAASLQVLKGTEVVFTDAWDTNGLHATYVGAIAENLEPGEYQVALALYNASMVVYQHRRETVTVEAGKTADVKI